MSRPRESGLLDFKFFNILTASPCSLCSMSFFPGILLGQFLIKTLSTSDWGLVNGLHLLTPKTFNSPLCSTTLIGHLDSEELPLRVLSIC